MHVGLGILGKAIAVRDDGFGVGGCAIRTVGAHAGGVTSGLSGVQISADANHQALRVRSAQPIKGPMSTYNTRRSTAATETGTGK